MIAALWLSFCNWRLARAMKARDRWKARVEAAKAGIGK